MPAILDVPCVIVSTDVTRNVAASVIRRAGVENGEPLRRIVHIVQCGVLLNYGSAVSVVGSDFAAFLRLEIESDAELVGSKSSRDVVGHVPCERLLLCGIY